MRTRIKNNALKAWWDAHFEYSFVETLAIFNFALMGLPFFVALDSPCSPFVSILMFIVGVLIVCFT